MPFEPSQDGFQMRFTVHPSPAGGYHVRMAGSPAPLSPRHARGGRGAHRRLRAWGRRPGGELVDLPDGSEVLVRPDDEAIVARRPAAGAGLGVARYRARPGAARRGRGDGGGDRRVAGPRARQPAARGACTAARGPRHRHLHRLAADREPQHAAPVRAARPGSGARPRQRRDADRRRAPGRRRADAPAQHRDRARPTRRSPRVFGLDNLPYGAILAAARRRSW